jgi:hypothetical protein
LILLSNQTAGVGLAPEIASSARRRVRRGGNNCRGESAAREGKGNEEHLGHIGHCLVK